MTATFKIVNDFDDISVDLFERYLNHPELIASLDKMPAFRSRTLESREDGPDGVITWRFRVVAGGDIPKPAQRVLSEEMLTWFEESRFVPGEHTIYWTIEPIADRFRRNLKCDGIWKLIPNGEGTRRVIEGSMTIKYPLIGAFAETYLVNELKKNYDVEPEIQETFYRRMRDQETAAK